MGIIETPDLVIKHGSMDDWESLYEELWSKEEVFQYLFYEPCCDAESGKARTQKYVERQKRIEHDYFIYEKKSGKAIGIIGILQQKPDTYTITDIAIGPNYFHRGYGKQVINVMTKLAFEELGADIMMYDCFEQNIASKNLAFSCGFEYVYSEEAEKEKDGKKVILEYYRKEKQ